MTSQLAPIHINLGEHQYSTPENLARLLGVSRRTLSRWDERRMGPPKIKVGKLVLYDLSKLHDWLASHERVQVRGADRSMTH